jgi:xanthine/uracil permease
MVPHRGQEGEGQEMTRWGFYPFREWGWFWIALALFGLFASTVIDHAMPRPIVILGAFIVFLFGVLAWPAIRRMTKGGP